MSVLSDFFHGGEKQMGIFAPRDHVVALFGDFAAAQKVERDLFDAGFGEDDVIAVPGEELVDLMKEEARHSGLAGFVMQALSRMFETEEVYAEHDFRLALRGAGFCAVFAPDNFSKAKAWKLIEPGHPVVARHYSILGVEHLAGET